MGSEDQVIVWRFEAELFQDEKYDSTRHGMAPKIVGSAQAKNIVMATSARGVSLDKGRRAVLLSNHLFTPRAFCKPSPVKEAIRFGELGWRARRSPAGTRAVGHDPSLPARFSDRKEMGGDSHLACELELVRAWRNPRLCHRSVPASGRCRRHRYILAEPRRRGDLARLGCRRVAEERVAV